MKRLLFILLFIPILGFSQYTAIPDENFEKALIDLGYDNVIDGKVLTANISNVDSLDVFEKGISDLKGIEAFTSLKSLDCGGNQLTILNVSYNAGLTNLACDINHLKVLDVSKNKALVKFSCYLNQLTSLDVSNNTNLTYLNCAENQLLTVDVSNNTDLMIFRCFSNQLTSLDLNSNNALRVLACFNNKFDCDALKAKYNIKY
tara:strand:- start:506 stop:1114 length:609 start_codon:yes stop_codon:yes gene_type:complete